MSQQPTPKPGILRVSPYVGGAAPAKGQEGVVKLSSNENPYGPSEAAMKAYRMAGRDLHRYPDSTHHALRQAIADVHGLAADRIVCGNGSDELLHLLAQCFSGRGDEVIVTEHGFAIYPIVAHAAGAKPVTVPEHERRVDVDAILAAVTRRTRLVFLANPANPTGTMLGGNEVGRLAASLPRHTLLVLDGAYAEFAAGYDGGAALVDRSQNVVMTRTFSKIHGLGGLRIGWAYGPAHVIDAINRVRGPFNLSDVQQSVAEAAIRDKTHPERSHQENTRLRAWLTDALREAGLAVDASSANFVLARFASAADAADCVAWLKEEGILVRYVANYGIPEGVRITVGDEASCRRVAHEIGRYLKSRALPASA